MKTHNGGTQQRVLMHEARVVEAADNPPPYRPTRHRASTLALHFLLVEKVIRAMRSELAAPLALEDLARIAAVSPFHLNRVFRAITGTPPLRFLSALRIAEAKRLILTTEMNVTEVCFEVGYSSLGSFSSRFKTLVGLTPNSLRPAAMSAALPHPASPQPPAWTMLSRPVAGFVHSADLWAGPVWVGLFKTPIPCGAPVAGALLTEAGRYRLPHVPNGDYYVFAASVRWSDDPLAYALPDPTAVRVGMGQNRLKVHDGVPLNTVDVRLRAPRLIDPPLLVDLLHLLQEPLTQPSLAAQPAVSLVRGPYEGHQ